MFFKRRRRLMELEGEVEILREEVLRLSKSETQDIITIATLEDNVKRLEKAFVGFIKNKKELEKALEAAKSQIRALESKVEELSKKKISETTTEDEETVSVSQILDEYLNGEDEE